MKQYNFYAINREDIKEKIQLNTEPVSEKDREKAERFYLARGEWLERGYFVTSSEIA